jgi:heptosyltransferase-2
MLKGSSQRIVVFLPNWVGDVVMATPALRALREGFPNARIGHVGRRMSLDVLSPNPWADQEIEDRSRASKRVGGLFSLASKLRHNKYDFAVLLPNSFRTAAAARLGGLRRVAGYDRDARGILLTDRLRPLRDEHGRRMPVPTLDYYLTLACHVLDGAAPASPSHRMELAVSFADQATADVLLAQAGVDLSRPVVMLNPGASFGPSKMWDAERYAAVGDELIERRGAQIIINAAPNEKHVASLVGKAMKHRAAINFADRANTLGLLKGLMRRCDLLITNDTGARHIAAAMGSAVVTIFGSTDPRWAQIDYARERIIRVDLPCSPCQQKMCPTPAGPDYQMCTASLSTQVVLDAAEELLASAQAEALR